MSDVHQETGERRREADRGRRALFRVWWKDGGKDLVLGFAGVIACVGCLVLAALWYGTDREQARTARETAAAAKLTCERTRTFAPYLIKDYRERRVFPPELLDFYESSLPEKCPD